MIIAGTTIGAGMLAIPIVTAGIWFYTALAVMIFSALVLMSTGPVSYTHLTLPTTPYV